MIYTIKNFETSRHFKILNLFALNILKIKILAKNESLKHLKVTVKIIEIFIAEEWKLFKIFTYIFHFVLSVCQVESNRKK